MYIYVIKLKNVRIEIGVGGRFGSKPNVMLVWFQIQAKWNLCVFLCVYKTMH